MKIRIKIMAILMLLTACVAVIACNSSDETYYYPWTIVSSGSNPAAIPHSGSKMAFYDSYDAPSGLQARIYRSSGFVLPGGATAVTLTFWMNHDDEWPFRVDQVQVQVSTDGGTTWSNVGSAILRYDVANPGWVQHTLDLTAYAGDTVVLGFLATSDWGNNMYLDDVLVTGLTPTDTYIDDGFETAFPGVWLNLNL
jgi:hypothetical protein